MTKVSLIRIGCLLPVIFAIIFSLWFFSSDLKTQLFDLPALEAKKQAVVEIISMMSANDQLLAENHYPLRETAFCFWGDDSWTYKSSRSWSEIEHVFEQSFVTWRKWPSELSGTTYNSGPFFVNIWTLSDANAVSTYEIQLITNDPLTPHCGPD